MLCSYTLIYEQWIYGKNCAKINIKYLCKKPSRRMCSNQWTVRREPSLRCHLKLNSWVTQAGKTVKPITKHPHAKWPCKRYSTLTMLSVCAKNILQGVRFTKTEAFPRMLWASVQKFYHVCDIYTISAQKAHWKTLAKSIAFCHKYL